jgi:hypothetical protein
MRAAMEFTVMINTNAGWRAAPLAPLIGDRSEAGSAATPAFEWDAES